MGQGCRQGQERTTLPFLAALDRPLRGGGDSRARKSENARLSLGRTEPVYPLATPLRFYCNRCSLAQLNGSARVTAPGKQFQVRSAKNLARNGLHVKHGTNSWIQTHPTQARSHLIFPRNTQSSQDASHWGGCQPVPR